MKLIAQSAISELFQDSTIEQDAAAKNISSNSIKNEIGGKTDGIALSTQMANKPAVPSNDERSKLIEKEGVEVGKVSMEIIGKKIFLFWLEGGYKRWSFS